MRTKILADFQIFKRNVVYCKRFNTSNKITFHVTMKNKCEFLSRLGKSALEYGSQFLRCTWPKPM